MINCKYCSKEIKENAIKCPHCRRFLKWYRNRHIWSGVFFVLALSFVILIYYKTLWKMEQKFKDNKKSFSITFVSKSSNKKTDYQNYRIKNTTNINWLHMTYNLIGYDKVNQVIASHAGKKRYWFIGANSTSLFSVKTTKNKNVVKWELVMKNLRSYR